MPGRNLIAEVDAARLEAAVKGSVKQVVGIKAVFEGEFSAPGVLGTLETGSRIIRVPDVQILPARCQREADPVCERDARLSVQGRRTGCIAALDTEIVG